MQSTFRDLIARNKRNSALLVLLFVLFIVALAMVLTLAIVAMNSSSSLHAVNWTQALIVGGVAAGISLLVSVIAYYEGGAMILSVSGARPLQREQDVELFNVVEEMAIAAGIPMPKIYVIRDSAPNAFATGRDPAHAIVAITTGLREKLTRDELQGVIAHEIAHIRNYDIRLMLLLATLVGAVVMMADLFWQMAWVSGRGSRKSSGGDSKGSAAAAAVFIVLAVILAILAPLLAQIIQLAVSRQREYLADASAVEFTRNPLGLAGALRKIDDDPDVLEVANRGTAHLYIANPIKKFEARANSMFASHPPIKDRIRRIESLAHA